MNTERFKKSLFIKIGTIIFLIVLVVTILSQMVFTIKATPKQVECVRWDATFISLESMIERYNSNELNDYEYAYSYDGELPSKNPNDYINIYCYFDVQNKSLIEQYSIDGTLKDANKYSENILFVSNANASFTQQIFRDSTKSAYIVLDVYIGNLNEDQINELVEGLTITVKANGRFFGTRSKNISFDECEDISFEM